MRRRKRVIIKVESCSNHPVKNIHSLAVAGGLAFFSGLSPKDLEEVEIHLKECLHCAYYFKKVMDRGNENKPFPASVTTEKLANEIIIKGEPDGK